MKLNADLDPNESVKVHLKEDGTFTYTVKAGRHTESGKVIVSDDEESSGVRVVLITEAGLEAPDPLIIRRNRTLAWTNTRSRRVKVTFS